MSCCGTERALLTICNQSVFWAGAEDGKESHSQSTPTGEETMNTKWTASKACPKFPGLLSVETVDDAITAIVVQGKDGPIRISKRDYGGLTFFVPTKPATMKRFKVSGKVDDLDISPKFYDDIYDAERQARNHDGLSVSEVSVLCDEEGNATDAEVSK